MSINYLYKVNKNFTFDGLHFSLTLTDHVYLNIIPAYCNVECIHK